MGGRRRARRLRPWVTVAGLTASALVLVGVLALLADGTGPGHQDAAAGSPSSSPSAPERPPLPHGSGEGERVVYSLSRKHVWLVKQDGGAVRDFPVWPGTLRPTLGEHTVSGRRESTTGGDGVAVKNVVFFDVSGSVAIGFSAALDGSSPRPVTGKATGGIRMRSEDSDALWDFAKEELPVVVVE
ncbi:L,D-transpeptidase [Streptomyces sp. UNOC14_S4]|uniref:L,D-transpeptidase n=1 Tax=Streptomyces sp. UNOC14_S4 TaxID=2872340 RepID=UPI001E30E4E1|nr:L,D-transpeptidase [Streptomyces sp. UNOC14_S4]